MCGIGGVFYRDKRKIDTQPLIDLRDKMHARGPDGKGIWVNEDQYVGLVHRRLSIIDLSNAGSQPMCIDDGNIQIVFNGEIFNYRELKKKLLERGCTFTSTSDTEVLLQMYKVYGHLMFEHLRGMFAFAIWDQNKEQLLIARDQFGIKPLYYATVNNGIWFASQVKALLKVDEIRKNLSSAGQVGFHLWGHIPEPFTLYEDIKMLPAGSYMIVGKEHFKIKEYFSLKDLFIRSSQQSNKDLSIQEKTTILKSALSNSVKYHLVADVPIGVFLSAGLDSSVITALATENANAKISTYTLSFDKFKGTAMDESPYAEITSNHYQTKHNSQWIDKEYFSSVFDDILNSMDQPTLDGVNTFLVSKVVAGYGVKVALSGLGGDELLHSYPQFGTIPKMKKYFSWCKHTPVVNEFFKNILSSLPGSVIPPKYAGLMKYGSSIGTAYFLARGLFMPWELNAYLPANVIAEGLEQLNTLENIENTIEGVENEQMQISLLEYSYFMRNQLLRDADWASMAHSLEIRVPFVDIELLKAVLPLMSSGEKLSKKALYSVPKKKLPEEIANRKKTGFNIPVPEWLQEIKGIKNDNNYRAWAKYTYEHYISN